MNRRRIASSMINSWAYDPAAELLEIEFQNGKGYQYTNVPEFIAHGFELAASKGHYFQLRIDGRYTAAEVGRGGAGFDS
jgi:hypothetical protein